MNSRDKRIAIQKGEPVRPMSEQGKQKQTEIFISELLKVVGIDEKSFEGIALRDHICDYVRQQSAPDATGLAELVKKWKKEADNIKNGSVGWEPRPYSERALCKSNCADELEAALAQPKKNETALLELAIEMGANWCGDPHMGRKPTPDEVRKRYEERRDANKS